MRLIIGGAYQAKKQTACTLSGYSMSEITDGESCEMETIFSAKILNNFHAYVKRGLENGWNLYDICEKVLKTNHEITVICNELGCGIVPVDPFDRKWREETGRLCTLLAEGSEEVYRVFAGIATRIK